MQYQIDEITKVPLGGLPQKIHIRGTDTANPLLLFLHGGPGVSNRSSIMQKHSDLCDDFTIVAWDQRGTGGSYKGCKPETLTIDQYVQDARDLCQYLCTRFGKQKLFVCGGSWGTRLGSYLCQDYPEWVAGYVGFGQVVNGTKSEEICYQFCIDKATEAGDTEALETLRKIGPPVDGQYKPVFEGLMAQRKIMKKYGGHSTKSGGFWEDTVKPMLLDKEYTLGDKWGTYKGYKISLSVMRPQMEHYKYQDLAKDFGPFQMPYYIFQGRHDFTTASALVQEYYDSIQAPDKDLIWFENSAHGPLGEEPEKFKSLMRQKLLQWV